MSAKSPHILLVGKHSDRIDHLDQYLSNAGWSHVIARDAESAVDRLSQAVFDVVIADLEFSNNEGESLLHALQKEKPDQAVIVISRDGSVKEALAVLRDGVRDFLQYPIDFDTLHRSVSEIVSGARRQEAAEERWKFVKNFIVTYEFKSSDLVENPFKLDFLRGLLRAGAISLDEQLQIRLAFQEAMTNSLEHGNLELKSEWKDIFDEEGIDKYSLTKKSRIADPKYADRKVSLTIEYAQDELRIVICDQGPGFMHSETLPQSKDDDDAILCYGRGLAIITNVMNFVEYREEGRLIEMRKRLCVE